MTTKNPAIHAADVQGIIISGYGHLFFSSYLFLTVQDAKNARQWLAAIVDEITTADRKKGAAVADKKPDHAVNLAFTAAGLSAFGLPADSLQTFSQEFQEGMTEISRSHRLGDNGASSPQNWEFGGVTAAGLPRDAIHVLLILQAATQPELDALRDRHLSQAASHGVNLVLPESGHRLPGQKEHFGFRDGIAEPGIEGSPKAPGDEELPIKAGEFILGYPNSYGNLPPTPVVSGALDIHKVLSPVTHPAADQAGLLDFGRNGSYLVFRKLHQDVAAFRQFFHKRFPAPDAAALMMAKAVGRWPSGAPLALAPDRDDPKVSELPKSNHFGYASDPHGYGCPLGAHVRRSNPRDSLGDNAAESLTNVNRHRIIRRGVSYGDPLPAGQMEDDQQPRGLLFICINADIKRQFEFLQQTWINNPKFDGLYNDPDPLIGDNLEPGDKKRDCNFTVPRQPIRTRIKELPRFVTVKGGHYFFLPSLAALRFLAAL
ncbi:MAG TPA: Dyp-type peroxidase [Verrucomicrobiae bacterium]|nr:Dyp-type peroxidase [Verrucomicrobiae bacterium]